MAVTRHAACYLLFKQHGRQADSDDSSALHAETGSEARSEVATVCGTTVGPTVVRHRGGRHRTGPKRRARRTRGTGCQASPNDPQCPQHAASPRGTRRWQTNTHNPRQASRRHPLARRSTQSIDTRNAGRDEREEQDAKPAQTTPNVPNPITPDRPADATRSPAGRLNQSTPGPVKPARPPPPPRGPRACCSQTVWERNGATTPLPLPAIRPA